MTALILPSMYPCLSTCSFPGRIQYAPSVSFGFTFLQVQQIQRLSLQIWILQGLFRKKVVFFKALRVAHWLFGCTDSGFWLGPEILSFIWDKSRPGDLSKNLALLGVSAALLSDTESYDQEIQPRTVWSAVLLRTTLIHEGYLPAS